MVTIRKENKKDFIAIKALNNKAFGQTEEGIIIDRIRNSDAETLSLVAEMDNKIVGHIFYSSAEIVWNNQVIKGMGLAPMAVLPGYQKQGIGKRLIHESLYLLIHKKLSFIIVLGHKDYYPKFGFETASKHGIKCQWNGVPDEVFMVMILDKEKMKGVKGTAKYCDEWDDAMQSESD
ncbi:GNAT family N-acetyltransferase [uncultured Draconibacterium sp.]|uniref:GNAT family N-acetyltransferase n=1 Tax=uncultured Draconibacterium sp. TaxID=1573823 RepID=UPI003749173F